MISRPTYHEGIPIAEDVLYIGKDNQGGYYFTVKSEEVWRDITGVLQRRPLKTTYRVDTAYEGQFYRYSEAPCTGGWRFYGKKQDKPKAYHRLKELMEAVPLEELPAPYLFPMATRQANCSYDIPKGVPQQVQWHATLS